MRLRRILEGSRAALAQWNQRLSLRSCRGEAHDRHHRDAATSPVTGHRVAAGAPRPRSRGAAPPRTPAPVGPAAPHRIEHQPHGVVAVQRLGPSRAQRRAAACAPRGGCGGRGGRTPVSARRAAAARPAAAAEPAARRRPRAPRGQAARQLATAGRARRRPGSPRGESPPGPLRPPARARVGRGVRVVAHAAPPSPPGCRRGAGGTRSMPASSRSAKPSVCSTATRRAPRSRVHAASIASASCESFGTSRTKLRTLVRVVALGARARAPRRAPREAREAVRGRDLQQPRPVGDRQRDRRAAEVQLAQVGDRRGVVDRALGVGLHGARDPRRRRPAGSRRARPAARADRPRGRRRRASARRAPAAAARPAAADTPCCGHGRVHRERVPAGAVAVRLVAGTARDDQGGDERNGRRGAAGASDRF